jgi:hypothetical protein
MPPRAGAVVRRRRRSAATSFADADPHWCRPARHVRVGRAAVDSAMPDFPSKAGAISQGSILAPRAISISSGLRSWNSGRRDGPSAPPVSPWALSDLDQRGARQPGAARPALRLPAGSRDFDSRRACRRGRLGAGLDVAHRPAAPSVADRRLELLPALAATDRRHAEQGPGGVLRSACSWVSSWAGASFGHDRRDAWRASLAGGRSGRGSSVAGGRCRRSSERAWSSWCCSPNGPPTTTPACPYGSGRL